MSQVRVLTLLDERPEKQASLKELEHAIQVAQPTAAGLVSRLKQKNFAAMPFVSVPHSAP
ncbi:MAG: hypothetical protein ACRDBO_06160 [Lachnospiraceae bacterium]